MGHRLAAEVAQYLQVLNQHPTLFKGFTDEDLLRFALIAMLTCCGGGEPVCFVFDRKPETRCS